MTDEHEAGGGGPGARGHSENGRSGDGRAGDGPGERAGHRGRAGHGGQSGHGGDAEAGTAWLSGLLDAVAAEYEPDSERLRDLVAARIAASPEEHAGPVAPEFDFDGEPRPSSLDGAEARPGRRPRRLSVLGRVGLAGIPAGAALATIGAAAAIAVGATATIAVTSNHEVRHTMAVLTPDSAASGAPGPSQSPSTQSSAQPTGSGTATRPASPSTHAPASGTASSTHAVVSATGSGGTNALYTATSQLDPAGTGNPSWAQLDVWVSAKQPLTSLQITIKVAAGAGAGSTGSFDSGAGGQFTEATTQNPDGSLTYTFTLSSGQSVVSTAPLEFAAQFNHAVNTWNAAADGFTVTAHTATSSTDTVMEGAY